MKILIISQYFHPENFRVNDLVVGLVARGYEVTVLTGQPNYPFGRHFPGYGWCKPKEETYAGAKVLRVPLIPRGKGGSLRLVVNYLSFVIAACWGVFFRLPKGKHFDAIFVFEPSPVTVGIPSVLARWRYQVPMLFWVLDLWPDSLVAVGAVRSPLLLRWVDKLVCWIYQRCDLILVQSRSFVPEIVRHGISPSMIRYLPNWGEAEFEGYESQNAASHLQNLPSGFRIMFAGNIGVAQDFPAIIEAATLLKHRLEIQWVIVGEGRMAAWAKEEVHRRGLEATVYFLGQHPLEQMPHFFSRANVLLVSLKRDPVFALTVPGKLQSYLASGKPILAMLDGEGAQVVSDAGAGLHCPAGDSAALARAVEALASLSPDKLEQMGQNGREYFAKHFARERVFDRIETWFSEVVELNRMKV